MGMHPSRWDLRKQRGLLKQYFLAIGKYHEGGQGCVGGCECRWGRGGIEVEHDRNGCGSELSERYAVGWYSLTQGVILQCPECFREFVDSWS